MVLYRTPASGVRYINYGHHNTSTISSAWLQHSAVRSSSYYCLVVVVLQSPPSTTGTTVTVRGSTHYHYHRARRGWYLVFIIQSQRKKYTKQVLQLPKGCIENRRGEIVLFKLKHLTTTVKLKS